VKMQRQPNIALKSWNGSPHHFSLVN